MGAEKEGTIHPWRALVNATTATND